MSGAEFIAVAGVISSIIAIVDGIKQVVDAASEVEGLPKAFRQASSKLPLVGDILEAANENLKANNVSGVEKSVTLVVDDCKDKWETLNGLFEKVIPEEKASRTERYYKAVKTLGKGGKVETLMKGILDDIQLLAAFKTMSTTKVEKVIKMVTAAQEEKVAKAITDVVAWPSSVPDNVFEERTYTNINYGTGQYNAQGDAEQNNFQGEARQYHSGGGSLTINEAQTITNDILNIYQSPEEDETRACMAALFLTDPRDDRQKLINTKGSRVDGTCEWIKNNALYKHWFCSHSQLLWLSGGPGKGKTMLSVFLAEELERNANKLQDVSFLQYFCDNKDEKRNTAVAIIRGMILQLLQLRPKLRNHILPSFKTQAKSLFTASSFETLWRIFESMLRDPVLGNTYCVLDGLDECDETSLEVLLKKFRALFSKNSSESSPSKLNLIVVSRDLPDFISEVLSGFPRIRLDPDADAEVKNDIDQFIEVKVDELSVYKEYPDPLRVRVKEIFQSKAQGTFLWVGIVAHALRKYKWTEVDNALDLFPSGLDQLYARMLLQIDFNRREIAAKILLWVVLAIRPLTLSELSVATNTEPSVDSSQEAVMKVKVSYCGSFLTVSKDGKVSLIHQSVKDYLLRKSTDSSRELEFFRVKEEVGNLEIAKTCLDYLQNGALTNGEVDLLRETEHLKAFPLLSYATLHWPEHARSLARSEDIFDLALPFYHKKSQVRISWLKTYQTMKYLGSSPESFTLLQLASYFGILPLVENLLFKKRLIYKMKLFTYRNKIYGERSTALIWAAGRGHEAVVRLLLEAKADIKAKNKWGETALIAAAESGHEAVVRLLLEPKADIEAKGGILKETALIAAARSGHEAVVRLLLEAKADIEAKDKWGETALIAAAESGHEAVVRLLLEAKADIKAKGGILKETALIAAAGSGYEAVVRLLLEAKADIEAKDERGETALIAAAGSGHEAVVRLLLEAKADIEAKDKWGETALIAAAESGHEAVVRLLLEAKADIKAKGGILKETALVAAAGSGHEVVVRLLLEAKADIEAKDDEGGTALIAAA